MFAFTNSVHPYPISFLHSIYFSHSRNVLHVLKTNQKKLGSSIIDYASIIIYILIRKLIWFKVQSSWGISFDV